MLKNALIAILFLVTVNCSAQQSYFVLIQADNNQPFYAQIDGKTFSSSDIGHLIISQLKDSSYNLLIGFPKDIFPKGNFTISINKKDQSFQLKNLGEKGWALFNTLTTELQAPLKVDTSVTKHVALESGKKEDAFARLMAGVVNDTSVMHHTVVEEEQPKKEIETVKIAKAAIIKPDTLVAKNSRASAIKNTKKGNQPVVSDIAKNGNSIAKTDTLSKTIAKTKAPLYRTKDTIATRKNLSFVKVLSEQKADTAFLIKYVDIPNKGPIDTIDIMIPLSDEHVVVPKKEVVQRLPEEISDKQKNAATTTDTARAFADTSASSIKKSSDSLKKDTSHLVETKAPDVAMSKNCKSIANDYDIDNLRIKMLALDNDDDKIAAVRIIFKLKCFSVKQVRALSEVFKTDEGKYKLFDATYLYVSDIGNFTQLQDLLSDTYYINRFKAMIR
jgi:hypothetical protein